MNDSSQTNSNMVLTVLEARVESEKWPTLRREYGKGTSRLIPQITQTYLVQNEKDLSLWRIMTIWKSQAALEEIRSSGQTPAGVLMFRAAGAEPTLSIYDIASAANHN